VTHLATRILAVVATHPAITTIDIYRQVRVRKSDVLAALERLRREQLLRFQTGHRGSKCWFVVPEPSTCSRTCSRATSGATSNAASGIES
jgi:hypothetical protein